MLFKQYWLSWSHVVSYLHVLVQYIAEMTIKTILTYLIHTLYSPSLSRWAKNSDMKPLPPQSVSFQTDRQPPLPLWRKVWQALACHWWQITKAGRQEVEERKEEGERERERIPCLSSGRLLDWRKHRGGRVVVMAYCLSSVCCGSNLSTHSSNMGYLYPHNIHAGRGRL